MSVTQEVKKQIVEKYARKPGDSGSVEVQVAILTERIRNLTDHLRTHQNDMSTRRGLLGMVARRNSLLKYLKRKDNDRYQEIVKGLRIRG